LPGRDPRAGYFIRGASPRIASSSSGEGSEDNLTFVPWGHSRFRSRRQSKLALKNWGSNAAT
jgi:hypothetical protein